MLPSYESIRLQLHLPTTRSPLTSRPSFFVAGLAVTLASASGFDRRRYLALAEQLRAGSTVPEVYQQWLAATPLPPSRLLPPLLAMRARAA